MCTSCTRRALVAGLGASFVVGRSYAQDAPTICSLAPAALQNFTTHATSGNTQIDHAMIAELRKILNVLPISPGFKFIDDPSPNAYAVPDSVVPDTQGTVYIGLNLINREFSNSDWGGVAVAGICAHECGHIYQFFNGYTQLLSGATAQLVELHADYIAGFYLGRDHSHSREHVQTFAQSLFSKGDYNFNNPQHHGTPQQRVQAMTAGYDAGTSATDIPTAIRQGADHVRRL
ncbi:hypothetical protein QA640_42720 [Bradyrhizobium sp. CB82]|uniref:hypothetical protein n=1 Tax=Bradyrhizobium sp. CB82 TaxID=3039159 RepID=UPI0024B1B46E|nr:hypothetical protein [Bradyrhizobium sp. CB82]WFU40795.1 hypothetical protein QA640_42720 [Bradyrhizobium sp. CB82]